MKNEVVVVLDCGATNVRAMAVDRKGRIIARSTETNSSEVAIDNSTWQHWSLDSILSRLISCCNTLANQISNCIIRGVTVTTFGVDGTLVDDAGKLLHPIISWKCSRTAKIMDAVNQHFKNKKLQKITGVGNFSFNTFYKLAWLKDNKPELLNGDSKWLFISSLINHRLTGEFTTDITMAGTGQLLEINSNNFSEEIMQYLGISSDFFPRKVNAGDIIGTLLPDIAKTLNLPPHIPVISTGHDTQFALFGAGAIESEPVLSSGTWEILMARTRSIDTKLLTLYENSTCELDSQPGKYNPGMQWLASGVLEHVRSLFWTINTPWSQIVHEASRIPAGCDGLKMNCDLLHSNNAGWSGVNLNSSRAHFYRAALEGLAYKLRHNLKTLESLGGFSANELLLVGGGSRNMLWNQIKADIIGIPIKVLDDSETTVSGAAMYAWKGVGDFNSAEDARNQVHYEYRYFYPESL
ncbi:L-fuculokinase [Enterobacter hormaechei]|uniref:L-fuculokinase n=1 Tax=Enterobacter hormaechei TaxID=158836 RepID=UPI003CEFEAF2